MSSTSTENTDLPIKQEIQDEPNIKSVMNQSRTSEARVSRRKPKKDLTKRYLCKCGCSYEQKARLKYHKKWEYGKPARFRCNDCSYTTCRKWDLNTHQRRKHSK